MQILVASLTSVKMMDAEDASVLGVGMLACGGDARVPPRRRHAPGARPCRAPGGAVARPPDRRDAHGADPVAARSWARTCGACRRTSNARALEHASNLTTEILEFAATVAGLAAENMVRGGGRLFLDFGRRMERAQAIAAELAQVLDQPGAATQPGRVEAGLRLALELRDSVITYRTRYLAVLQPAPALDLILADEGNPRGLAFQLVAARELLREIVEDGDSLLTGDGAAAAGGARHRAGRAALARPDGHDGAPAAAAEGAGAGDRRGRRPGVAALLHAAADRAEPRSENELARGAA